MSLSVDASGRVSTGFPVILHDRCDSPADVARVGAEFTSAASADAAEAEAEAEYAAKAARPATGLRAAVTSFLVLALAEFGDLSQLFTAGLVVRFEDPVSVFLGSWLALVTVAALAIVVGRALLRLVRLATLRRISATICSVLAVLTGLEAAGLL